MRYALKNNTKIEAEKNILDAVCGCCFGKVIPACGNINIHHWKHKNKLDCDPWYEPLSEWHLNWQNSFYENFREVIVIKDSVKHIADIKNNNGTVIEFQNSPINTETIQAREIFYDKMVWVFNIAPVKHNFIISDDKKFYAWYYPKRTIYKCKKPVFIDIGDDYLYWINKDSLFYEQFPFTVIHEFDTNDDLYVFKTEHFGISRYRGWPMKSISKTQFIKHYNI